MMVALLPTPALANISCVTDIYTANATPSAQSVQQGATASYAVTVVTSGGAYGYGLPPDSSTFFSTLSVQGLPAGFTATFTSKGYYQNQAIGQLAIKTTTGYLGTYTLRIIAPIQPCMITAGNDFTLTVTDTTDTTAPTTTATLAGTKGNNGYYTSAVTVTLAATDPDGTSDVATTTDTVDGVAKPTYTAPFTVSGDGTHPVTFSSTDKAGNAEATKTQSIMIDATAPTSVVGTPDRAPNATGWYHAPVTVKFRGQDATSGIDTCTSTTYSGPDSAAAAVSGSCTDKAGNTSAAATVTFKYDATKPTNVVGTPDRAPNATGWYNAPVMVTFSGKDATSGIATCTTAVTYSGPDSATASVTGTCTDTAGNVATAAFALTYDATKPMVTYTGNAGTYTADQTVSITCGASDNLSGVASSTCKNIAGPAYTFNVGANSFSATATDNAGNVSATATATFTVTVNATSIDAVIARLVSDPTVAASLQDQANAIASAPNANAKDGKLNAFVNHVNAQTGKAITTENAAILITLATGL